MIHLNCFEITPDFSVRIDDNEWSFSLEYCTCCRWYQGYGGYSPPSQTMAIMEKSEKLYYFDTSGGWRLFDSNIQKAYIDYLIEKRIME